MAAGNPDPTSARGADRLGEDDLPADTAPAGKARTEIEKTGVINWLALGVSVIAVVMSGLAWGSTRAAEASAARAEIVDYAHQMVQLDREADERNVTQLTLLAEQTDAVIDQYGQNRLRLAPSTYRVLAQYTDLGTDNGTLAEAFGNAAVKQAQKDENVLEELRAYRVLASIAGQKGDTAGLESYVGKALDLAEANQNESFVIRSSSKFTGAFAVYDALWAANHGGGCDTARAYYDQFKHFVKQTADEQSLETSRRAYRLRNFSAERLCGISRKDLRLDEFKIVWVNNHQRT